MWLCHVQDTGFFCRWDGRWDTPYGHFFLKWYSDALIAHARSLLQAATSIFNARGHPRCTVDNHIAPFTSSVHTDYGSYQNLASVRALAVQQMPCWGGVGDRWAGCFYTPVHVRFSWVCVSHASSLLGVLVAAIV